MKADNFKPTGAICELPENHNYYRWLCGSISGEPYYFYIPKRHNFNRGNCLEVLSHVEKADKDAVNAWQALSENDCLRARGDWKWQAACSFTGKKEW